MKTLISVNEIKHLISTGKKELYVEPGAIITPAARDTANEAGISINFGSEPEQEMNDNRLPEPSGNTINPDTLSPELVSRIVMEVIANLPQYRAAEMVKEAHPGGLRLVRGNTVCCKSVNSGNGNDKVGIKELLTLEESPNMCAGFMTLDSTSHRRNLPREEINYIVEGTLDVTVQGKTYRGRTGDVFYLPAGSNVTFSSPDLVRVFFVTYPAKP